MLLDEAAAYFATIPGLGTYVPSGIVPAGTEKVIVCGSLPSQPDKVLALREYGAGPSDLGLGVDGVQFEYPGLQIVARGEPGEYVEPRGRIERAYQAAAKVQATTLSGTQHLLWLPRPPFLFDRDESNRYVLACNVIVQKRPSAA